MACTRRYFRPQAFSNPDENEIQFQVLGKIPKWFHWLNYMETLFHYIFYLEEFYLPLFNPFKFSSIWMQNINPNLVYCLYFFAITKFSNSFNLIKRLKQKNKSETTKARQQHNMGQNEKRVSRMQTRKYIPSRTRKTSIFFSHFRQTNFHNTSINSPKLSLFFFI